ncbi:hypothetical protein CP970_26585 [Streptomyces kanamyceticus]|uniref:Uncharacterized protein n=2 Tax=Streptomyces kanamyceticus TaxID=1967 RepID=A0A5J6GTM4_STRKN|nr:hypothetical protein CP970_26585 [Streptomyces kanamyceticus]
MGWVDREHIPTIEQDWRYTRLINMTKRLLEAKLAATCSNCTDGTITIRDGDGNETTIECTACGGTGMAPTLQDNEDNGQAGG